MAAAFYNALTGTHNADSAGTYVEKPGQTLLERKLERPGKSFVVDAMNEIGINIEANKSTQLTKDMLENYDAVISMAGTRYTPKWLAEAPNYTYWKIQDPLARSYAITARTRDTIKQKIEDFIGL